MRLRLVILSSAALVFSTVAVSVSHVSAEALRAKVKLVENMRYSRGHHDPEIRSCANAVEVVFHGGETLERVEALCALVHEACHTGQPGDGVVFDRGRPEEGEEGGVGGVAHGLGRGKFPCAENEAGRELPTGDDQRSMRHRAHDRGRGRWCRG